MLPTFGALVRRKIPVTNLYPICLCKIESILHSLWGCRVLKELRNFWFPKLVDNHKGKPHFFAFVLDCAGRLNSIELGLLCVCLWKVWAIRNSTVHELTVVKGLNVVEWASFFLDEFLQVGIRIKLPAVSPPNRPVWIPLDLGFYKINYDAAVNGAGSMVGFGVVIRDEKGLVMAASSQAIEASFYPQVAETGAIFRGL
ncbi:hypothetical protein LWI28_022270 [Acer negundo]|uniref:RNase H type-1 domain-containing protein n=1 Tax=Acer negundo TaxID=4023 RepID=A0AAD5IMP7_ACENE|nr:hypothetical protein LWI28_022270 [Acer negundo]